MSKHNRYTLPSQPGIQLMLGQLNNAAKAVECAAIIDRYPGLVMLITTNMKNVRQLHNEIHQLTYHPVITLPEWEPLPYDSYSPHQKTISDRLSILYRLSSIKRGIIILSINTLMQRVCPYSFLQDHTIVIKKDHKISRDKLHAQLKQGGYQSVHQVMNHGEFSIRGMLLDLFPMGSDKPYRIKFFDNKIDGLHVFDIHTQCTLHEAALMLLFPAHEFPTDKTAMENFCSQWRKQFPVLSDEKYIYQQMRKNTLPAGIEYWQPLFFNEPLVPLFIYQPAGTLLINTDDLMVCATRFWNDVCTRYDNRKMDPMRPLLSPETLWLKVEELFAELRLWPQIQLSSERLPKKPNHINMDYQSLPDLKIQEKSKTPLAKLRSFCKQFDGSVIFSVQSEERWKILKELLLKINIHPRLINRLEDADDIKNYYLIIWASVRGFIDSERGRALICEGDLLEERINSQRKDNCFTITPEILIQNLTELHEGQLVVHLEHGLGRYAGMTILETSRIKAEYLVLHYADNDTLYVPISSLDLISRYIGGSEQTALHKLGSGAWARERQKATKQVYDMAAELLDIYAKRSARCGFAFHYNQDNYQLFCKDFPFKPTPDQETAINSVLNDMCQPLAMDRLVCGDVGFGKTEVAIRAAFLAIENQKQVMILVPTTLLAQQHFNNFQDRFVNWPVHIEMISRFFNARAQNQVLEKIAEGKVNILIGTHKLLHSKIKWHDLGLLIIDEEHRFGVRHKEHIKTMRANVDILTLTATPIPRTLSIAMNGIRDLSIIATPPPQRLAVKTFVLEYDNCLIREAILREILRGGQVYYLYNDLENIKKAVFRLKKLVPEARIAVGHGKMNERDLEQVMQDFYHQRFNVLVCTTIIETGIDIANANTIIIERADHFGLAQLHQLRGRVGRSHYQAYAYLLVPPLHLLPPSAHKRLEAISSLEDLGAGFSLAIHDLEIRGAGEFLGEYQSGQMERIGFSLYMKFLEIAVKSLKAGHEPLLEELMTNHLTTVELHMPILLPDDYIPDVNIRLSFYKRIASTTRKREIEELKMELIDRFGLLPDPAHYLLAIASLKQRAKKLGIKRIEANHKGGFIEFNEINYVDSSYLIDLLHKDPIGYRLDGPSRLKFIYDLSERTTRLDYVDQLLKALYQHRLSA